MIRFQDFLPRLLRPPGFLTSAEYDTFEQAVDAANQWVAHYGVKVLNMETVVLPNITNSGEQGSTDAHLRTYGETSSYWYQFVRVWYETQ